ncbi:probable N-acetylglucosaminyl-phosphatidylinositol de-N-acetylase [Abrus precatorius]|uniref:N-acetylglucosaminylphosphatidylinositol deacetylase n=1 Tax=Abrus precatorius TaxID=3816 RepID=A0A8B8KR39_ABRPR|nr:probable N-acetylglucosaminyl-phosphatidylinositol de-N-acetylase [Abrus precatorius]
MAWILIVASLFFLWIISLCKVLLISRIPFAKHFSQNGRPFRKRHVLLVIAHPDDESMFFTPTINFLTTKGHNVQILCLSIGDADGKGYIRKQELFQACVALKIPMQQVKIVQHPDLQDGFGKVWNHSLLEKIIEEEISNRCIDTIITFDNYGVSGHCNHRDVHYGVCKLLFDTLRGDIEVWELVSTNILRKYSGPVDIWLSMFWAMLHSNGTVQCLVNGHSHRSFKAMAQHASQWVWFRKLFVALSSYTYINTLRKVK